MSDTKQNTFQGWAAHAKDQPLVLEEFPLKTWDEDSVEFDITHCSICSTDVHCINSSWFPADYPLVAGHELTGVATRIGANVKHLKVGDRVGAGPLCWSCNKCKTCLAGDQNVCENRTRNTYGDRYPESNEKTYGGFANKWRGDGHWAFKIPDSLTNAEASSFLCAGVTCYTPLKRWNVGPTSTVGVMGMGGLGHFAVLFAKAMGATVVGMSTTDGKRDVSLELGCDDFVNTSKPEEMAKYTKTFTHIICTGTSPDFKWDTYFAVLRANGIFMNVNAPTWNFPELSPLTLLMHQVVICGSASGAPHHIREMFEFADEKKIRPWFQTYPMAEVNKALEDFNAGKARFRFVLEN